MLKRVLIVDDECNARISISALLSMENFYTVTAENGKIALDKMIRSKENNKGFDLLITDVVMDGMSGLDLINKVKEHNIPIAIVVMSAFTNDKDIVDFCNLGCYRFIGKPIDKDILLCMIKDVLEKEQNGQLDISIASELVGLLYNCPFDNQHGLPNCAIKETFQNASFYEKMMLMQKMSNNEIIDIIGRHKKCISKRINNE